jgi:hypothetical protein
MASTGIKMKVEFDNAETVIDKQIVNGKLIGLTKWNGRKVKVVILNEPANVEAK